MQPFYSGLLLKYHFTSFIPAMWPGNNCLEKAGFGFIFLGREHCFYKSGSPRFSLCLKEGYIKPTIGARVCKGWFSDFFGIQVAPPGPAVNPHRAVLHYCNP